MNVQLNPSNSFRQKLQYLFLEPSNQITDSQERRQVRLLTGLLLVFLLLLLPDVIPRLFGAYGDATTLYVELFLTIAVFAACGLCYPNGSILWTSIIRTLHSCLEKATRCIRAVDPDLVGRSLLAALARSAGSLATR